MSGSTGEAGNVPKADSAPASMMQSMLTIDGERQPSTEVKTTREKLCTFAKNTFSSMKENSWNIGKYALNGPVQAVVGGLLVPLGSVKLADRALKCLNLEREAGWITWIGVCVATAAAFRYMLWNGIYNCSKSPFENVGNPSPRQALVGGGK
ncbi:MAG: hypothetical protein ChlgKO_03430 [Chlamydiales bacterium]